MSNTKKVLLLANQYDTILDFRMELIKALVKKEYEVYVALPSDKHNSIIEEAGCTIINLNMSRKGTNPISEWITKSHIERVIRDIRPDVVLTFTIKPNIYGGLVCSKLKVPYIANITGLGLALESEGLLKTISILLYRLGLGHADIVFFQNAANQDFMLSNKIVSGRFALIPGSGVNTEKYTLQDYPDDSLTQFAYVSRVMKEKGIDQYLEMAVAIKRKYPNTLFHVCGMCEQGYQKVMSEMVSKGVVQYHGQVDNISEIYRNVHCIVHPSFYPEGLSNVLLEASASGRPIITTDKPGCKEIVEHGINGYVVKQRDSADLINKVETFLSKSYSEKRQMGINGRARVVEKYNRSIVVDKYLTEIHNSIFGS